MRRIIWILPDAIFPSRYGGRMDMLKRLKALNEFDVEVQIIMTVGHHKIDLIELEKYQCVKQLFIVKRQNKLKHFLSLLPHQVVSRNGIMQYRNLIKPYDIILIEGYACAEILMDLPYRNNLTVLRVHNDERRYMLQQAKASKSLKSFYFFVEALKYKIFQKKIRKLIDKFLFISNDEMKEYTLQNSIKEKQAYYLPYTFQPNGSNLKKNNQFDILLIMSFHVDVNVSGLKWFMNHVLPILCSNESNSYSIAVAGYAPSEKVARNIESIVNHHKSVTLMFNVEDLSRLYSICKIAINPVKNGAGLKIKTIEALSYSLPIIMTKSASEGILNIEKLRLPITDDAHEFANKIEEMLSLDDLEFQKIVGDIQKFMTHFADSKSYQAILAECLDLDN